MIVNDLAEASLRALLKAHPYRQFPVVLPGQGTSVLTRVEAERTLATGTVPKLQKATTCLRDETILRLQNLLIESDTQFVVVLDRPQGQLVGLVTLHDLLRAQTQMAQKAEDL